MKLEKNFYLQNTLTVAKELLGKVLVFNTKDGIIKGEIIETEAYLGKNDPACHSYKGKPGGRVNIMYKEGGYAYIYMIYGMYYCLNIVTEDENHPEAVLIRAVKPLDGIDIMIKNMKTDNIKKLCNGPGKLCKAFGIDKSCYGADLCGDTLYLEQGDEIPDEKIMATPRINVDYAGEASNYLYRFIVKESPFISVKPKTKV